MAHLSILRVLDELNGYINNERRSSDARDKSFETKIFGLDRLYSSVLPPTFQGERSAVDHNAHLKIY